jgi:CRISPR system Cascade subunit CasE
MYMSRIALNRARRGTRNLLGSPYRLHAAVEAAFHPSLDEPEAPRGIGRILWRVDHAGPHTFLYVVSPQRPDFTHIVEQAGWPTEQGWETSDYNPFLERLADGQRWAFRLVANPVHMSRADCGRDPVNGIGHRAGKRVAHVTIHQQRDWFVGRAEKLGFRLPTGAADAEPTVWLSDRHRWQFQRGGDKVTLSTVRFDGALEVTDANLLRQALVQGVGRAKGFGCGLLTLAALPQG